MFHHLRKALKWLEQPYTMVRQIIKTDIGGENYISSTASFLIYVNIQNKEDGESIVMGRNGALVYKTIILLSKDRIGFGDPVYPDLPNSIDNQFLLMDQTSFRYMDQTSLTFNSNTPDDNNDSILYFVKAFGQVYRIMLEGGVQDLSYDPSLSDESVELDGYVYYRYYADLVRGPWQ
jgi:hypothetical protein